MDSVLNIRKPLGWSSFDVVRWVKKRCPKTKVGHAGTLDPFAEGVLLVCTGKETKKVSELMAQEKEYETKIQLGVGTDSLDVTGKIVKQIMVPDISIEQLEKTCEQYTGEIEQIPPLYSALKVNGKRAYKLARAGEEIEMPARKVYISRIVIREFKENILSLKIVCSKGTYIRSLARDFADSLDTVGYLKSLVRTRVGEYTLSASLKLGDSDSCLENYFNKNRYI